MGKKSGTLNKNEQAFIERYLETKTDQWIADELNRSLHQIIKYRQEFNAKQALKIVDTQEGYNYRYQLRSRKYWAELQKQFTPDELILFEDYWTRYIEQFSGDILYTEESQLIDLIRYELLINRNLKDQNESVKQVDRIQHQISEESRSPVPDRSRIETLENMLLDARATSTARSNEHVKLQSEKNKLFGDLKATRDKRIKQLIDDKISIFTLFRQFADHKKREKEAKQAGAFRLAMDKEHDRLTRPHKFDDGTSDMPILSADTLEKLDNAAESDNNSEG